MASTYINRAFSSSSASTKATWSYWLKISNVSSGENFVFATRDANTNNYRTYFRINDNNSFAVFMYDAGGTLIVNKQTTRVFRDPSAWYHVVYRVDTTQANVNDRVRLYVNNVEETSFTSDTNPSQNATIRTASSVYTAWGHNAPSGGAYFDGSMSHINFIDGTAYDASAFGEFDANGVWTINTAPSVTYGTNGFFILKNGNSVTDQSGNSNNFTVAGGTLTNTEDNPSNVFATLNSLTKTGNDIKTVGNGNTSVTASSPNGWGSLYSTLGASTGKFYCEVKITDTYGPDANNFIFGIQDVTTFNQISNEKVAQNSTGFAYRGNGNKTTNNVQTAYGDTYTTGNIIGVAMDLDNSKLYFSKDGVWQNSGDPTSGSTGTGSAFDLVSGTTYVFGMASYYTQDDYQFNFGNGYFGTTAVASAGTNASGIGIFEYDVPTGYTALSTKGLNL